MLRWRCEKYPVLYRIMKHNNRLHCTVLQYLYAQNLFYIFRTRLNQIDLLSNASHCFLTSCKTNPIVQQFLLSWLIRGSHLTLDSVYSWLEKSDVFTKAVFITAFLGENIDFLNI